MADIFISYAKTDLPRVEPLAKALEEQGWSIWWDRKITPGKTFSQVIEEAIDAAKCVIVLWSNESVKSDWVQNEAAEGARRSILVPALIDDVQIPFEFRRIQAADLTDWKAETIHSGFTILLSAISEIVGPSPLKVREAEQKREEEERKRREVKAERKPEKPEPAKFKPTESKLDATATTESESPKPRKSSHLLKFSVVAGVIVLLIIGIWWWVAESQKKKLRLEVETKMERILEEIALLEQNVSKTESLEQLNDSYNKGDVLGRELSDIARMPAVVSVSQKAEKALKRLEELSRLLITQKQNLAKEERIRKAEEAKKRKEAEAKRKAEEERMTPPKFFTNTIGMKFVLIPAGNFTMGSPPEEPGRYDDEKQHEVTISKPFYLQTTEVTRGQWQRVMGDNPSRFKECGDDCPVEMVSWDDAQKFIEKLNEMEGNNKFKYQLPTEAEWEYACRAKTSTPFSFKGDASKQNEYGWYYSNSEGRTHPVKTLKPNLWGLYDMHGNVWEWCQDWYKDYPSSPITDQKGPAVGVSRVLRGGSWFDDIRRCRSANRNRGWPDNRNDVVGFRLARSVTLGP